MGRGRTVTVIMWREDEDHIILGVTTLESFGLEVGLVKGMLKEAELLLLAILSLC